MTLKVRDLVYAADAWMGEVSIQAARVVGVGKKVRLADIDGSHYPGLHFGRRVIFDPASPLLAPSRVEALIRYDRALRLQIDDWERAIASTQARRVIVRKMIAWEK
jgi:hypothetical protein